MKDEIAAELFSDLAQRALIEQPFTEGLDALGSDLLERRVSAELGEQGGPDDVPVVREGGG